jgi:hypothetical protein
MVGGPVTSADYDADMDMEQEQRDLEVSTWIIPSFRDCEPYLRESTRLVYQPQSLLTSSNGAVLLTKTSSSLTK